MRAIPYLLCLSGGLLLSVGGCRSSATGPTIAYEIPRYNISEDRLVVAFVDTLSEAGAQRVLSDAGATVITLSFPTVTLYVVRTEPLTRQEQDQIARTPGVSGIQASEEAVTQALLRYPNAGNVFSGYAVQYPPHLADEMMLDRLSVIPGLLVVKTHRRTTEAIIEAGTQPDSLIVRLEKSPFVQYAVYLNEP